MGKIKHAFPRLVFFLLEAIWSFYFKNVPRQVYYDLLKYSAYTGCSFEQINCRNMKYIESTRECLFSLVKIQPHIAHVANLDFATINNNPHSQIKIRKIL